MRQYKNKNEINHDLKRLSLERQIAWEEIKGLKEGFRPHNWVEPILTTAKRYGIQFLLSWLLKKKR